MDLQVPEANQQPGWVEWIFFNQRGLRPGWRLLIFVIIVLGVMYPLGRLLGPSLGRLAKTSLPSNLILQEAIAFAIIVFASWVMSRVEKRDMGEYGLPLRNSGAFPRFIRGFFVWGFLPLSVLLLVLRGLHAFYFGNLALHATQMFYWGAVWGLLFVLVGLFEEYSLRGYLLYTLAEGIGFWPAAVFLAAIFAVLHTFNPGEARIGILMTAMFAMFASVMLRYAGNLWIAVGAHAGWDWGESYFYGVNDSGLQLPGHLLRPHIQGPAWLNGGSVGPEGSILSLPLLVVMSVVFVMVYRRSREPVLVVERA